MQYPETRTTRWLQRWRPRGLLAVLSAVACSNTAPPPPMACADFANGMLLRPSLRDALIVASVTPRYDGGRLHEVLLRDRSVHTLPLESTGDTLVRPMGEALAVLHRAVGDQDNLTLFAQTPSGAPRVCQVSLLSPEEARASGPRPWVNAYDAVPLDAGTVLVTRHRMSSLAVVDVAAGRVARTLDLTPLRGTAMGAWPASIARVGEELWVTLGRHDNAMVPTARGAVARLDAQTLTLRGVIELPHANPIGPLHAALDGTQRWVATVGSYNRVGDGAVEAIDVATGRVLDPVVTEADVDGNIDGVAVLDARRLVLRVTAERVGSGAIDDLRLVLFDRQARTATTLHRMDTYGGAAPLVLGDRVVVGDPGRGAFREGAGLRFFTREGMPDGPPIPLGNGLFPYDIQRW